MKNKLLVLFLISSSVFSNIASADYPKFNSSSICNGYPEAIGIVSKVTSAQTYDSTYGVYIEMEGKIKDTDTEIKKFGGRIYPRTRTDYAYQHMISLALISQVSKMKVKMCYNNNDVYALELQG